MTRGVGRFFAILIGFSILLSLGAGSIVHAAEPIGCAADAVAESHNDTAPESPSDSSPDKATQHVHGGCHGHHVATADDGTDLAVSMPHQGQRATPDNSGIPDSALTRTLRPPIA